MAGWRSSRSGPATAMFVFLNSGFSLTASGPGIGAYGEAKVGFNVSQGTRINGFIEATGRYSDRSAAVARERG